VVAAFVICTIFLVFLFIIVLLFKFVKRLYVLLKVSLFFLLKLKKLL